MLRANWVLILMLVSISAQAGGMGSMMDSSDATPPPTKDAAPDTLMGYKLTQQFCAECHQPPGPDQHTAADWPMVVTRMMGYIHKLHFHAPDEHEEQLIIEYLSHP